MHALHAAVDGLMRKVGRDVVMRRFGALAAGDVEEKAPGDPVTVADREAEAALSENLSRILPGSAVVGEEGVAADPALLDRVGGDRVWIVDPIDGTANYAAGRTPFAVMVALAEGGVVQAGWVLNPATGRMCHAARGGGAYNNNMPVRVAPRGGMPRAALGTRYLPDDVRGTIEARADGWLEPAALPHCAGEQYAQLALGDVEVALFWRSLPWDHAPGALFLEEAGGRVARLDGTPYGVSDDRTGLLAAASPALWDEAARLLFG